MTHPAFLLTPAFTFWTFSPVKFGVSSGDRKVGLSFRLTWINALLTTVTTLVLAVIGQFGFDLKEPASPLGYFFIFTLPCFAIAMICLLLIQFLTLERSKWLLPISVVVIAAIFVFIFPISLLTNEGVCSFIKCFNWNEYCNQNTFNNSTLTDFSSPKISWHGIDMSVHAAVVMAAVVIVTASIIACCCTYLCHQCCQKSYENNCFPMTNKIKYDTFNL